MSLSAKEKREKLLEGLNYLRRHALDAHHSGDGMLVIQHSALALRKCASFGQANFELKIDVNEIRWAFILGMYWTVQDWFLYVVSSSLNFISTDNSNKTDYELIVKIHDLLNEPHSGVEITGIEEVPSDWWVSRGGNNSPLQEEDSLALTYLIELVWYADPETGPWKKLISNWIQQSEQSPINYILTSLKKRLDFQTGFYNGQAFHVVEDMDSVPIEDPIQEELFQGWISFYNCNWKKLELIVQNLQHKISVEHPSYVSLFYLLHLSRFHLKHAEDQFLSLPRLHLARSRQPSQLFQHFRESYADSQFLSIATAGFPKNSHAKERFATMRMAMLISLQGLRTWNLGTWRLGIERRANLYLELGTTPDLDYAMAGILDSVRSHTITDNKTPPNLANCLRLLDALDLDKRISITKIILIAPPIEWRYAYIVLRNLSDAIPIDMLAELAEWSLKVEETALVQNLGKHTFFDVWNNILLIAPNRVKLIERLAPVLRKLITKAGLWESLHRTLIAALSYGPPNLAVELSTLLVSTECNENHFNLFRFSIAYNALNLRPELNDIIMPFLQSFTETPNKIYQRQILKQYQQSLTGKESKNDPAFKKTLKTQIFNRLKVRENLTGPKIPIGKSNFFELANLISWTRSETDLVDALVNSIESESVLYSDKQDYLALLGVLAKEGPLTQARKIANKALKWLTNDIQGRSIIPNTGGPLSTANFSGFNEYEEGLLFLIEQCSLKCPSEVLTPLLEWLPLNITTYVPKYAFHILKTEFALISSVANKSDQTAAILVGLVETTTFLSINEKANAVIRSFNDIVLDLRSSEFESFLSNDKFWSRTMLRQWTSRLDFLSKHILPEVRESTALTVKRWINSNLPKTDELYEIKNRLSEDCRLRVRHAINISEQDE